MFAQLAKMASGVGRAVTDKPHVSSFAASPSPSPYNNVLGERRFRLCRIKRDPSERGGLALVVREFDLDMPPPYCAVSYTWGPADSDSPAASSRPGAEERVVPVLVNQIRIRVTQNLFDFLQQCVQSKWFQAPQHKERTGKTEKGKTERVEKTATHDSSLSEVSWLWIDAVCINQDSPQERTTQRYTMGEIYIKSAPVPIWLGKEAPNPYVRWVLEEFIPAFNAAFPQPGFLRGKDPKCVDAVFKERLSESTCNRWRDAWIPFLELLGKKRWFRRGWAVQEVIVQSLSKQGGAFVLFGYYTASWQQLRVFLSLFHLDDWSSALVADLHLHGFTTTAHRARDLFASVANITTVRNQVLRFRKTERARRGSLDRRPSVSSILVSGEAELDGYDQTEEQRAYSSAFRVLQVLQSFRFSDPRDHVYSSYDVLSFLAGDALKLRLELDYRSSVADVYTGVSWHFVSHMASLDVLSRAGCMSTQPRIAGLPSWAVDFSKVVTANFLQTARAKTAVNNRGRASRFDASGLPLGRPVLQGTNRLALQGTCLDVITSHSSSLVRPSSRGWDCSWFLRAIARLGALSYAPTGELVDEALTRTLLADSIPRSFPLDKCPDVFRRFWLHVLATTCRAQPALSKGMLAALRDLKTTPSLRLAGWLPDAAALSQALEKRTPPADASLGPLLGMADRLWSARVCFSTTRDLVGIGHFRAEVGDEVWLLEGGRTPFVLRRRDDGAHELVGEAYLHGFMYGEGMAEEGRRGLETVVLV